jgi:hypothetical protein
VRSAVIRRRYARIGDFYSSHPEGGFFFGESMTNSSSDMGFLASADAITKTVEAVENLGKAFEALAKLFDAQRSFDKLRAQLTFVTGSVGDAALAFKDLQSLAAATPFSVEETAKAFIKLRMAGLDPSEKALRAYGDTAAGLGESLDKVVGAVADAAQGNFEELEKLGISAEKNGGRVSLTFQGATDTIGNNAKEIEAYLQKLAQTKFGDAMAVQSDTLDGAIGNLHDAWSAFTLSLSQAGLGDAARAGIEAVTDALKAFGEHADAIVSGLKVAAEIGAAYFAVFVAGPAIVTAATTVFAALEQQVLLVRLAMATGASTTDLLTNSFGGMSVSARLAEGSLSKVKLAGGVMMAAFAGWEIGSWLNDNFVEARLAGLTFVGVMLTGWENLKYGAQVAWETISFGWDKSIGTMRTTFADFLSSAAKGFSRIGATDTAKDIEAYATRLRAASNAQGSYSERIAGITAAHKAAVAEIDDNVVGLMRYEMTVKKVANSVGSALARKGAGTSKQSNVHEKVAASRPIELEQQRHRQAVGNSADVIEKEQAELASLRQQTQAQIDHNEQIGLSQKQVAELTAKHLEEAAARKDADAVIAEGLDLTGERADRIRAEAQAIRERAAAIVDGAAKQEAYDKTVQDLSAMVGIMSALDGAAQSAAQGMANAFGSVGKAIGGMTTVLTGYERKQAEIAAQLASATRDAHGDPAKIARANQMAAEASAQAQIKSYGDMAGAAKGFFNENSKGYKVLGGIEKAYRAAEMAMALESMAKKIFFKETEVAANTTLNATKLAGEATASAASTGLAATEAGAWGITAVVKAIASMPFPLNLAAGAATLAAVVAVGAKIFGSVGASGQSVSQERQASQGTGTVLGNSSAKSESIKRAIELSASNSSTQINYLSGMLTALQSIQSNISGFASEVLRTTDVTNANAAGLNTNNGGATTVTKTGLVAAGAMVAGPLGALVAYAVNKIPAIGNMLGKISTSIFGGKQNLDDSGITMDKASLASIQANGAHAKSYADITTSGGWFRSDRHDTKTSSLDADANRQFTAIIVSLADSVKQAGMLLGMNGDAFSAKLNTFVVDIGKISLKGLKGEDLQKELESVFSKLGDQMAQFGVDGLQQFQKVGEGYLETLMRVATDYAKVDASLQSIGKTFGATGVSSIAARENLIALLGGIDGFQSKTADYASNFLTKAQQLAPVAKYVTQQLTSMNLGWVQTREQFAGVVAGLDLTTTAGQQTYAALMNLESAFAATHEAIVDTTKSAQDIADERKDLQNQLDQLTMTSAQLQAKQRDALDDSNKALFDQVQATKKVKDAQDAAKTSLGNFVNQMKSFATTAKGLNNSLALGSLSTLTPEQQYAEARRQFDQTRQQAAAGDATAQGNLQSVEQTFLQMSQKINGGNSQYSSDLATVMQANDQLAQWATQSVDVAQASLDALNDSSATLTDISATLTAIAQGVQYLPAALAGQDVPILTQSPARIDYSRMGTMDMAPLVAEVKALRGEVKGLRAEALRRTADLIQASMTSAEQSAGIVVEGVRDAATDSAWAASNSKRNIS